MALVPVAVVAAAAASGADLPPTLVAEFTRNVQPLLLNKCGAGACHGNPNATSMPLGRIDGGRRFDRRITLGNIDSLLDAVGPSRDPGRIVTTLGRRHPESAAHRGFVAAPLSIRERATLEGWLAAVRAGERPVHVDPEVVPVGTSPAEPPSDRPNRLKALLETAANPPVLPPPQEPQGLIFKKEPLSEPAP